MTVAPSLSFDLPTPQRPHSREPLGAHGRSLVSPTLGHQGPDDAGHLVGFRHPHGLGGRVPQCNSQPSSVAVNVTRPSPWLCRPLVLCSIVPSSTIGQF